MGPSEIKNKTVFNGLWAGKKSLSSNRDRKQLENEIKILNNLKEIKPEDTIKLNENLKKPDDLYTNEARGA